MLRLPGGLPVPLGTVERRIRDLEDRVTQLEVAFSVVQAQIRARLKEEANRRGLR